MDKKEILDILDNAKDDRGAVPMRLVRQALDKLSAIQPISSVQPKPDCVSRQAAIDALDCISGVEEVLRSLPSAQPKQRWIPCSERLPEERGFYLTTTKDKAVYCDHWNEDNFDRTEMVIAWMPLPEPYRGGDAE